MLIGAETYKRPWVKYEIQKSHRSGKGLLGVYIHSLKNDEGQTDVKGANPFDYIYVENTNSRVCLSEFYPTYWWLADDGYNNVGSWIEAAAKKAGR